MSDAIAGYLDAMGLGRPLRTAPLGGKLPLANGDKASAALCLMANEVVIAAAIDRHHGVLFDLATGEPGLQLREARFSDRLQLGEHELKVGRRGSEVREILALGQLRGLAKAGPRQVQGSRYVETPSELERWLLGAVLLPDELLLVWLPTSSSVPMESPILGETSGELRLLVTDQRVMLVALSSVGDLREETLEAGKLVLEEAGRERRALLGRSEWLIPQRLEELYLELGEALAAEREARAVEIARAGWKAAGRADSRNACRLLGKLSDRGHHRARIALALVRAASDERLELHELPERLQGLPPGIVAEIWRDWDIPVEAGQLVLASLRDQKAEPWALELHRGIHNKALEAIDDAEKQAELDLALAHHLEAAGERAAAAQLLTRRLEKLPNEQLDDLLPAPDADLTTGAGGQRAHIQLHELLVRVRGEEGRPDPAAAAELARLQPLVPARLQLLASCAEDDLAARAQRALDCLGPGGLNREHERPPPAPADVMALPEALVMHTLQHPLMREGQDFLGFIQSLLAQVETPDLGVLRDYCEVISTERKESLDALEAAGTALGVGGIEGYISRGRKSVGTRAYEGSPPFVLVGGRHLDDDADYHLSAGELRFAIAAEVAHVRYEHTRVTSSEVWAGAMGVGKQGLDLAIGVLPLFKGAKLAGRLGALMARLQSDPVQKMLSAGKFVDRTVKRWRGTGSSDSQQSGALNAGGITTPNEALLAAHRVMQLTADRAGLLLAADLRAALRGMFLVRPDLRAELPEVERDGLLAVLGHRHEDGHLTYQDLAVRAAALISFYLSDEYRELVAALTGHTVAERLGQVSTLTDS